MGSFPIYPPKEPIQTTKEADIKDCLKLGHVATGFVHDLGFVFLLVLLGTQNDAKRMSTEQKYTRAHTYMLGSGFFGVGTPKIERSQRTTARTSTTWTLKLPTKMGDHQPYFWGSNPFLREL